MVGPGHERLLAGCRPPVTRRCRPQLIAAPHLTPNHVRPEPAQAEGNHVRAGINAASQVAAEARVACRRRLCTRVRADLLRSAVVGDGALGRSGGCQCHRPVEQDDDGVVGGLA